MAKTKFRVDIHKQGSENDSILKAIASHNGGKAILCTSDFISFATFYTAMYPTIKDGFYIERDDADENKLHVTEDKGKTWTLTIEEITVEELEEYYMEKMERIHNS